MALTALTGSCSVRPWAMQTAKGFGKTKSRGSEVQPFRYFTENQLYWSLKQWNISIFCGAQQFKSRTLCMLLLGVLLFQAFGVHTSSGDSGCTSRTEPLLVFHHIITVLRHHISILSPLPLERKGWFMYKFHSRTNWAPSTTDQALHDKLINALLTPLMAVKGLQMEIFADTAP